MSPTSNRLRRALVTGGLVVGASLGAAGIATAATSSTTPTTGSSSTTAPAAGSHGTPPSASAPDPATMTHGPDETPLTGTQLQQATTAATAAVPGATIIRAETNSSGASPFEVHMKKADGSYVTVELNSSFGVVTTVSGFCAGHGGPGDAHAGSRAGAQAGSRAGSDATAPSGAATPTA